MRFLTKILENKKDYLYINLLNNYNSKLAKSNPTILFDEVLFVNFRCINYLAYISLNEKYKKKINGWISSNLVTSTNYLGYFENDILQNKFKKLDLQEEQKSRYNGLEDAILTKWENSTYLCGTRCDKDTDKGRFCIYTLNEKYEPIKEIVINDENYVGNIEKHWSPIEGRPFTFIKWTNPTEIITIDRKTGDVEKRTVNPQTKICSSNLRGNCQTVKYKDGYLGIVHDTKRYYNKKSELYSSYKHYFIQYNKNLEIVRISKPFNFEVNDIEFCCGLQIVDGKVYISYSVYDAIPVLIKFNEEYIDELFDSDEDFEEYSIKEVYERGNEFLKQKQFYAAAACYSRIFSNTEDKSLEYYSLMKFCICLLACKRNGQDLFSSDILSSFIDDLLLLKDNKPEPYYLYSVYYETTGDTNKREFYRRQAAKRRFEFPEIKQYLKLG